MLGKFVITRSGSNRHDHSGPGDWLAQTGTHDTEKDADSAGRGGVPNNDQTFVQKSKFDLEIKQKWVDFPSSDDPRRTVRCNICEVVANGGGQ